MVEEEGANSEVFLNFGSKSVSCIKPFFLWEMESVLDQEDQEYSE